METQSKTQNNAELILKNRKCLNLNGIEDVISFDESAVYLITNEGNLLIEGTELHITALDVASGDIAIEGHIRALIYNDKETPSKNGFFAKMFK